MQEQHVVYIAETLAEYFGVVFVVTAAIDTEEKGDDKEQEKEQKTA